MQDNSGMSDVRLLEYLDFELEIGSGRGREYPVAVLHSPAGEVQEMMQFPFDDRGLESQLKSLQIALLRSGGQRRVVTSPEEKSVQNFGRALFDALLVRDVHTLYAVSRREALGQGKGLRVKLRIEPPELAMLPWEFLYDSDQVEYVCLSRITPVVRYLELPQPIQPLSVVPPLRILGMVACPSDLPKLDVTREKGWVEEAIRDLHANGLVKLTWLEGHTWRDLQQALRRGPWHIFHFVGHGGFDRNADEGFIALADESGKTHRLKATLLGRLLADHGSLRLVLLNACEGARGSEQDIFSSTAAILVQRGIPAVLAMQYEITDQAALEFARSFYGALADSLPVDAAVAEARKAVSFAVNNTVEWGTPALYMRSPDGVLFHIQGRTKTDEVRQGVQPKVSHEAKEISAQDTKEVPEQEATVEAPSATQSTEEVLAQEVTIEAPSIPQDIPSERLEELYNQGMEHFHSQSWEKAVEAFDELAQIAPWFGGAGQILIEVKDRVGEAEDLERKTARKSEYMEDLYRMGNICLERGQWGAAADYLRRIDEAGERYKDAADLLSKANRQLRLQALYTEGAARLRERKWTEAIEVLEEIVGLDPTDERARARLRQAKEQHRLQTLYEEALEHLHEERWSQAIGVLEKISGYRDAADRLKEAQRNRELTNLYYAGVGCLEDGRWQDAIDKFREIIRRVETYKDVADKLAQAERRQRLERLFRKGKDYLQQQRWKEAVQELEKASVVDPDRQDILAGLEEARWQLRLEELRERGAVNLRAGNWQGAIEILGDLCRIAPLDADSVAKLAEAKKQLQLEGFYNEGMRHYVKERWGKAATALGKVVSLAPDYRDAAAKLKIAQDHARQGNLVIKALRDPVMQGIGVLVAVVALIVAVSPSVEESLFNPAAPTPRPGDLCNGSFEDDLKCWRHGGELSQDVKCRWWSHCYAVLGDPDYACDEVPVGESWIMQTFEVPQTISPTLSLRYRIFSYDLVYNDFFQVSINGNLVGQFGNTEWEESNCGRKAWDSRWQMAEFDLSSYKGGNVELLLHNVNGTDKGWNTWTYVDEVEIQ